MNDLKCIFCGSKVGIMQDIVECDFQYYVVCEHEDCAFSGPYHFTREKAVEQYRKVYSKFIGENDIKKTTWNYRVVKTMFGNEANYAIHEVFYDENDNIEFITEEAVGFMGESKQDLENIIKEQVLAAFDKETIDYEDVENNGDV